MIALLPLRGWVGDAMAGQLLQQQLHAIKSEATHIDSTGARGQFDAKNQPAHGSDCEGHAGVSLHGAGAKGGMEGMAGGDLSASDCATCPSCQVCHGVAIVSPMAAVALSPHPQAVPSRQGEQFASAEAVQGFKPPIL